MDDVHKSVYVHHCYLQGCGMGGGGVAPQFLLNYIKVDCRKGALTCIDKFDQIST